MSGTCTMPVLTLPGCITYCNLENLFDKTVIIRFYTVDGLAAGVGYTVCFSTIYGEIEQGMEKAMEAGECREVRIVSQN